MNYKKIIRKNIFICSFIFLFCFISFFFLKNFKITPVNKIDLSHSLNSNYFLKNNKNRINIQNSDNYLHKIISFNFNSFKNFMDKDDIKKVDSISFNNFSDIKILEDFFKKNKDLSGMMIFFSTPYVNLNKENLKYVLMQYSQMIEKTNDVNVKSLLHFRMAQIKFYLGDKEGCLFELNQIKAYPWNFLVKIYKKDYLKINS